MVVMKGTNIYETKTIFKIVTLVLSSVEVSFLALRADLNTFHLCSAKS